MIKINVNVDDALNKVREAINRHDKRKEMYDWISVFLYDITQTNFDLERSPNGKPFKSLSQRRINIRGGSAHPILTWTRLLRNSITPDSDIDSASISTDVEYAYVTQHGNKKVPARPYMGLSSADEAEIERYAENYLFNPLL